MPEMTEQPKEFIPCPFCAYPTGITDLRDDGWHVECWGCGAVGPSGNTEARAIERWNARKALEAKE